MKLLRFLQGEQVHLGAVKDDGIVNLDGLGFASMLEIIGGGARALELIADRLDRGAPTLTVCEARLLAPVERPGKYLAIGMYYAKHVAEADTRRSARASSSVV